MATITLMQAPAHPLEATYSDAQVAAMLRAILRLFDHWGLQEREITVLLGGISTRTLHRWRADPPRGLSRDICDRMSILLGIHKALRIIFDSPEAGYQWVKARNTELGGVSALQIMLGGGFNDLVRIRSYLDNLRGGW